MMHGYSNSNRRVSDAVSEMDYSPDGGDDGDALEVKREHVRDGKGGEKGDKRGVINRVNREPANL